MFTSTCGVRIESLELVFSVVGALFGSWVDVAGISIWTHRVQGARATGPWLRTSDRPDCPDAKLVKARLVQTHEIYF